MILKNATLKYKGYDPDKLVKFSHKKVCCSCDICGRVRWLQKFRYHPLCRSCSKSGERNGMYGKKYSKKERQEISNNSNPISGKDHYLYGKKGRDTPNWKGGFDWSRPYVLPIYRCNCLNDRFHGSEGHHINRDTVIFIPKELHRHLYHNLKNNDNINIINILSYQYLNGDYK